MGGGMMTGNAKGMATGMNALGMMTIGPDGTIYLMRRLQDTSATTPGMQMNSTSDQFEMVAMNGADGSTKWTITLPGVMMSAPVLAPDGKIFMSSGSTTFDGQGLEGGMMNAQGSSVISPASMIMVTSTGSSAQIGAQVAVDSQMMGDPQIGKNPDGSYTVYMTGFAISSTTQQQGLGMSLMADGEMYLYAFQSNGTLKYKTDLGAAQMGYGPGYAMKGQRRMT
ncbi:MAG TPA: hypothetical protein VN203_16970, partial [Candidatus Acidoferrum sp.]|nr:hypothetical protein [Candidatus Acidoferrum sp.]